MTAKSWCFSSVLTRIAECCSLVSLNQEFILNNQITLKKKLSFISWICLTSPPLNITHLVQQHIFPLRKPEPTCLSVCRWRLEMNINIIIIISISAYHQRHQFITLQAGVLQAGFLSSVMGTMLSEWSGWWLLMDLLHFSKLYPRKHDKIFTHTLPTPHPQPNPNCQTFLCKLHQNEVTVLSASCVRLLWLPVSRLHLEVRQHLNYFSHLCITASW